MKVMFESSNFKMPNLKADCKVGDCMYPDCNVANWIAKQLGTHKAKTIDFMATDQNTAPYEKFVHELEKHGKVLKHEKVSDLDTDYDEDYLPMTVYEYDGHKYVVAVRPEDETDILYLCWNH